jgi:hypothetical protein
MNRVNATDAIIISSKIGDIIKSQHKLKKEALPKDYDHLAATVSCLEMLAQRCGD